MLEGSVEDRLDAVVRGLHASFIVELSEHQDLVRGHVVGSSTTSGPRSA